MPHSLSPAFLGAIACSAQELGTLRQLGEYRGRQELFTRQRPEVLASMRQVAMVESSESSNRLEGITAPHARVKGLVLKSTSPRDRSEQEIAGYRDALDLIHGSASAMPFSPNVIRQLHGMLYRYVASQGGEWKPTDNEIVERGPSGEILRVRFRAVSAVETPQAMEDLCSRTAEATRGGEHDPLIIVPLAILDFLCIHPFLDGNGRAARLLTLQLLYQAGYEVGRYISLERIFEDSKKTYYDTLETSSKGWHQAEHDGGPWLRYFWGVLLRAYSEFEERVGQVGGGRGSKSQQVRDAVQRKLTPFKLTDLERDCPGVSRDTVRVVLRELRKQGMVVVEGRGPGARWRVVNAKIDAGIGSGVDEEGDPT